jgi:hypothetical protein
MNSNPTEFAVGIILACVGGLLLYTQYEVGYWGIVALGLIFVVKNFPRRKKVSEGESPIRVKTRRSELGRHDDRQRRY